MEFIIIELCEDREPGKYEIDAPEWVCEKHVVCSTTEGAKFEWCPRGQCFNNARKACIQRNNFDIVGLKNPLETGKNTKRL